MALVCSTSRRVPLRSSIKNGRNGERRRNTRRASGNPSGVMVRPRLRFAFEKVCRRLLYSQRSCGESRKVVDDRLGAAPMSNRTFCDGLTRRDALRLGTAGLFGLGLTLPDMLSLQAAAPPRKRKDLSLIYLFLHGGLSTIDTWDMKPDAPTEFRGEFQPIK